MDRDISLMSDVVVPAVEPSRSRRHVMFGSVLAGSAVTITTHVMLGLLGAGIGLGLIPRDKDLEAGVPTALAVGAAVWWLVATIVAVFAGAYVAGSLSDPLRRRGAALHGIATWGVSSVIWM